VGALHVAAYSYWRGPRPRQDPLVNILLVIGASLLVWFVLAFSFESGSRLRRWLAAALLVVHAAYVARYSAAYSLSVRLLPLLDVFVDPKGRVSAVLDVSQLMLIYLVVSNTSQLRKVLKPFRRESRSPTEPRPGS